MSQCIFCGAKEEEENMPLCRACGALRYPVDKELSATMDSRDKLKLSAAIIATIVTPGSLFILALVGGVLRFNQKNKSRG